MTKIVKYKLQGHPLLNLRSSLRVKRIFMLVIKTK